MYQSFSRHNRMGESTVTVGKSGSISLSDDLVADLGDPERVHLAYDPETGVLRIDNGDDGFEGDTWALNKHGVSAHEISCRGFSAAVGIKMGHGRRWRAEKPLVPGEPVKVFTWSKPIWVGRAVQK